MEKKIYEKLVKVEAIKKFRFVQCIELSKNQFRKLQKNEIIEISKQIYEKNKHLLRMVK